MLKGLQQLHAAGKSHGALSSETVFLAGQLSARLAVLPELPCGLSEDFSANDDPAHEISLSELTAQWRSWQVSQYILSRIILFKFLLAGLTVHSVQTVPVELRKPFVAWFLERQTKTDLQHASHTAGHSRCALCQEGSTVLNSGSWCVKACVHAALAGEQL